ncbi:MAG: hypothetical protein EXR18_01225 [Flavobacteriaceae bacterium]|nr:hypothetical protein [Flavobacteriaceae bacterium]
MKKQLFILSLLLFSMFSIWGQKKNTSLLSTQSISGDAFVGIDVLSNLYYIENNVFFKKNNSQLWQYKNLSLGKITKIDLQNPLKIVLFYEDFNSVILLDNQLNEIQKIDFSNISIPIIATAIGIASQNNLWVFDSSSQKLGLYNYSNGNFKSITISFQGNFKHYESDFNTFQWIDDKLNWFSCDIFGKITLLRKVTDFDKIQILSPELILFSKGEHLYFQDFKLNITEEVQNVDKTFEIFIFKDQILSIFTNRQIKNYKIIVP